MNGNSILYVEDDDDDKEQLKRIFEGRGVEVEHCSSIQDAKEKLLAYPRYRLVFVDLKINGASAIPLVRWIRDTNPAIPIIVLTGTLELTMESVDQLLENGADRAFAKPLNQHNLLEVMSLYHRTGANFQKGKPQRSWKTSLFAGLAGSAVAFSFVYPEKRPLAMQVAVGCLSLGMVFCADSSVMTQFLGQFVPLIQTKKKD